VGHRSRAGGCRRPDRADVSERASGRKRPRARVNARQSGRHRLRGLQNIRVNAVSAGPLTTLAAAGISGFSSIPQVYRERAPLRRTVDLAGVADAALFLLSPASRPITGRIMTVDAGFHVSGV